MSTDPAALQSSSTASPPASAPPEPAPSALPQPVPLTAGERRVLGVLIEKAKTTPDAYPMSINSIVTACNQKTNRDPLTTYSDVEAEDYLASLQRKGMVIKTITGTGRVPRWRHELYSGWQVNKVELAVLAELLLRGAQTEGELRTRASRMETIDDIDALRPVLQTLAHRGFVVYLSPPGRRGTTLTHGLYEPAELEQLKSRVPVDMGHAEESSEAPPRTSGNAALQQELAELRTIIGDLRTSVAELAERVRKLEETRA